MPRALSSAAIARRLIAPLARMSAITGARSRAWSSALRAMAARSGAPLLPARRSAAAPLGLPSFTPRLLATLSASFLRREIASRSCCATSAMIPTLRSFASGRSTAANLTPASRSVSRKGALRDSRSSFAITGVAPRDLREVQRLLELGPVRVPRALDLGEAGDEAGAPLARISHEGRDHAVARTRGGIGHGCALRLGAMGAGVRCCVERRAGRLRMHRRGGDQASGAPRNRPDSPGRRSRRTGLQRKRDRFSAALALSGLFGDGLTGWLAEGIGLTSNLIQSKSLFYN